MHISFQLSNEDFITFMLYNSSRSKLQKKRRLRVRILIPVIYICYGIYSFYKNDVSVSGIVFLVIGILWFAFYPFYSRWRSKEYYRKHVEENHKNRVNKTVDITIDENSIKAEDPTSTSIIKGGELKELIETQNHYFIKLNTDQVLLFPKKSIENPAEFTKRITTLGATYVNELNWKWK